ncbi:MAG: hypothetical protein K0V04_25130 [Deltaproteobacteria bacterium]|nr:hypothetical protein [Deltaproteobacteria bacterium]
MLAALLVGCGGGPTVNPFGTGGTGGSTSTSGASSTTAGPPPSADDTGTDTGVDEPTDSTGPGIQFDLGPVPDPPPPTMPSCDTVGRLESVGLCDVAAKVDHFDAVVQWSWAGFQDQVHVSASPLVANLTDDNDDGVIDLCDTPDVVVLAWADIGTPANLHLLDGQTGAVHWSSSLPLAHFDSPALGDLDGDGLPEIVASNAQGFLFAFEHDGTPKWMSNAPWIHINVGALAIADLDNDDRPEIIAGNQVFDHQGQLLWTATTTSPLQSAVTAADLDGDGDLEVVLGHAALDHDGAPVWTTNVAPGFPHVADLDGDGLPEVLVTNQDGVALIEHDGIVTYQGQLFLPTPAGSTAWRRPGSINDFDADGLPELALVAGSRLGVVSPVGDQLWFAGVQDQSGVAGVSSFDFFGDGSAEVVYADELSARVYDSQGGVLFSIPRLSRTGNEIPVIADVDGDGSAELIVISDELADDPTLPGPPPVRVISEVQDRWVPARRIWNQHAYHVTHVREDGTIPRFELPSWEHGNSFRSNAQSESSVICEPEG